MRARQRATRIATIILTAFACVPTAIAHQRSRAVGEIALPAGWSITSAGHGPLEAVGTNGCFVELDIPAVMLRPNPWLPRSTPNVAPFGPAVDIFPETQQRLWDMATAYSGGVRRRFERIIETAHLAAGDDSSALIVYDCTVQGRPYRSLSLVIAQPTAPGNWLFYQSTVSAPRERFATDLPMLLHIWQSYRIHPGVGVDPLRRAAQSLESYSSPERPTW